MGEANFYYFTCLNFAKERMKVKKPPPMETETKTPAPVLHKKTFKNKNNKKSGNKPTDGKNGAGKGTLKPTDGKNGAGKGTLTSQLLDAAAANLASATPEKGGEIS